MLNSRVTAYQASNQQLPLLPLLMLPSNECAWQQKEPLSLSDDILMILLAPIALYVL
jgi:hypothetical protein